jgi:hypothetical protein
MVFSQAKVDSILVEPRPEHLKGKILPVSVKGCINVALGIPVTSTVNAIAYDSLGRQVEVKPDVLDLSIAKSLIKLT